MSVKEKAKDLALSIKESEEYKNLKSAEARLSLDPMAQDLLQELRQKQQKVLLAQHTGQQIRRQISSYRAAAGPVEAQHHPAVPA